MCIPDPRTLDSGLFFLPFADVSRSSCVAVRLPLLSNDASLEDPAGGKFRVDDGEDHQSTEEAGDDGLATIAAEIDIIRRRYGLLPIFLSTKLSILHDTVSCPCLAPFELP